MQCTRGRGGQSHKGVVVNKQHAQRQEALSAVERHVYRALFQQRLTLLNGGDAYLGNIAQLRLGAAGILQVVQQRAYSGARSVESR